MNEPPEWGLLKRESLPLTVDVFDSYAVPLTEAIAVVGTVGRRHELGIAVFIAIIHVRRAMVVEVFSGALDSISIATLLGSYELGRRSFPILLSVGNRLSGLIILCAGYAGACQQGQG